MGVKFSLGIVKEINIKYKIMFILIYTKTFYKIDETQKLKLVNDCNKHLQLI